MVNCPVDLGYGGGYGMMGYGMPILGFVWMVLFWAALILAVVWLYRQIKGEDGKTKTTEDTPLDILKKRYAKGEITKEQYKEMKKDID